MDYIVNTPCGTLQGCAGRVAGTAAYKGIRYATAERWKYPQQVTHWDGVYDATQYGACCYQARSFYNEEENLKKIFYYREFRKGETYHYSEDCLFLNIFTPDDAKEGDGLPVLVYIHGGGFTGGCGHEKQFDGPVWPAKGVIGVTLNYRLGPLGFLCLPQLKEEAGYTGNYGLCDQMTAIQWVNDNIAAFGGDPENITIMGQSAGAASVQMQSCSSLTDGLFQKAVMSSGCGLEWLMSCSEKKAAKFWQAVMDRCQCKTLEEFRALPVEDLFAVWQQAKKEIKGGNMATFPIMDGRFAVKGTPAKEIHYMAGGTSEDIAPPILLHMTRKWVAAQKNPGYTWLFDRQLPGDDNGAWHSADLWYWFGTLENCWRPMTEKDYALSEQMCDYLINFCKTGDPNNETLPCWKPSVPNEKAVLCLGEKETTMRKPDMLKLTKTMLTNKSVGE